ncbi:hypothetical protein GA0061098_1001176 [Bradyrhizobium shewense]|uniref:Uncharacterized protein n=1 Tax=Bradyrhizobium shewense TaxID=1761772 RepID=A0A1C3TZZ8_9BRAD|nr:hypothetical protein GA0061098_1001176 [Bradyrhizobium shewense]
MQGPTRPILRMMARLRAVRALDGPQDPLSREATPFLILVAIVLALLFAILEVDLNSAALQSLGLIGDGFSVDPIFKSP